MGSDQWRLYKAIRAPYSAEVWALTLEELADCPHCGGRTLLIPFPAPGVSCADLEALHPRDLPPLDAALFLCAQPECLTLYLIIFSAPRQDEFEAMIPYLLEAGRRALAASGHQDGQAPGAG